MLSRARGADSLPIPRTQQDGGKEIIARSTFHWATPLRFSFVAHVEKDTGCYPQANVRGGNSEPSEDLEFSRDHHPSNDYNVMPRG